MAKHSKAFLEITSRIYLPLGSDLKELTELHGINFSDLMKHAEVINFSKPRNTRKTSTQTNKKATGDSNTGS
jgi:hypothetical protein